MTLFLLSGTALAVDLNGTWVADNWRVPGNDLLNLAEPKYEESKIVITQNGPFFTATNIYLTSGEECGGVIKGKKIYLTCPPPSPNPELKTGTLFHGEMKGKNRIVGINQKPDEGATCYGRARRQ